MKSCDKNIESILQFTAKMIKLAEIGNAEREDTGCGILYGVLLSVHPAKKNANFSTTLVIHRTAKLKALTNEYDSEGGFKRPGLRPRNIEITTSFY